MRGKTPTPTTLKIMRGNPGRRPLNPDEPSSPLLKRMPPAPGFLDDEGRRVWSAEGRRFIKAGLLTALDLTMFGTWCIWYSKRDVASRAVNQSGIVVRANGVGNPLPLPLPDRDLDVLEGDASDRDRIRPKPGLAHKS